MSFPWLYGKKPSTSTTLTTYSSGAVPPFSILGLAPKNLTLARPQLFGYLVEPEEIETYTRKLFQQLESGVEVDIYKEYSLDQVAEAHEALEGRLTTGKLLIKLD